MINVAINENGVVIAGVQINEGIFQEEKVDWRVEDRVNLIISISHWLSESPKKSDKALMLQDIEYLASIQDKYVFSSIVTNEYIAQSDDPTMFYDICRTILEEQGLSREEAEELLLSNVEITEEQSNALSYYFSDRPFEDDDWIQFLTTDVLHNDNWQICEDYEHMDLINLRKNAQTMIEQPSKKPLTHVFMLQERDSWYSKDSAVSLGIFSSLEKALDAAKKEYGELERDGNSDYHYEPINNPNNVTIYIIKVTLDEFEEIQ